METMQVGESGSGVQMHGSCEFYKNLSPEALKHFTSLVTSSSYPANIVLFQEKAASGSVYVVLEGEVRLSINSSEGRRLSIRIAGKGEILGLASALSGKPHEMTAETLYPAKLAPIGRREFLGFLMRYPVAYQAISEEISREYAITCGHLRTLGLSSSVPEKLARLLLDWSETGQTTESGSRLRFSLTHEQIGEFIGASRETVTRTLSIFKERQLVACHGSILTIPSRAALQNFVCA
jgi:CRP/FNR family transcriptional regulator